MKYAILVRSNPITDQGSTTAVHVIRALLRAGHEIVRVFFYQDGVLNGLKSLTPAQDDALLPQAWHALASEHGIELMVCAASATRHGVLSEAEAKRYNQGIATLDEDHFVLGGLGSWVEAVESADRVLTFGGRA